MQVTFDKKQENYLTGFITGPLLSKKYLSDVPIKDLAKSDKIRKYPIGIGPYKVKKIVPGEAVQLVKFDDYWQGKPALDKINLKVIDQARLLRQWKKAILMLRMMLPVQWQKMLSHTNAGLKVLSAPSLDYGLIGFVSHDYDKKYNKTGKVRPKYEDKELRKAMLYAIDREKWIKAFQWLR